MPINASDKLPDSIRIAGLAEEYLRADATLYPDARPMHFSFESGGDIWHHGFLLHPVPGSDLSDVQSPYGYGGPVATTTDPDFLAQAHAAWSDWCRRHGVLVEFVRFHPLAENWAFFQGDVFPDRQTVWMDLSIEDLLMSYHQRARTTVRKALKNGVVFKWTQDEADYARFVEYYDEDMRRLGADASYFFPEEYFKILFKWQGCRLACCTLNGRMIAAAMFLSCGSFLEYHLSASSPKGRELGAVCLLLHEAAVSGQQSGFRAMHLGGGSTPSEDNGLLYFKSGFSKNRAQFQIGRRIHDQTAYEDMKGRWEAEHGTRADKVLFYRF